MYARSYAHEYAKEYCWFCWEPFKAFLEKIRWYPMASRWMDALKEEVSKHNTAAALRVNTKPGVPRPAGKAKTLQDSTSKTSNTPSEDEKASRVAETVASETSNTLEDASRLGPVASWSVEFGFVSVHDPTTGEWWDLPTKDAPDWAVREARKRKELYRDGNRKAYRLTAREMSKIWDEERTLDEEGIVEEHPVEEG